jgi:predicted amidophosphoribosyltransferase
MLKSILSLFLKPNCVICERPGNEELCAYCQKQIQQCKLDNHLQRWSQQPPLFTWGVYEGPLKRAIASLKYNKQGQLGELFGFWLGKAWQKSPLGAKYKKLIVLPIPLHAQKLKARGFNQAELIAKGFCQFTGDILEPRGLIRVKQTQALFGLSPGQRKKPPQFPVLLLDDIYTTGTTAKEAIRVLQGENISVVGVAVLATPKLNE